MGCRCSATRGQRRHDVAHDPPGPGVRTISTGGNSAFEISVGRRCSPRSSVIALVAAAACGDDDDSTATRRRRRRRSPRARRRHRRRRTTRRRRERRLAGDDRAADDRGDRRRRPRRPSRRRRRRRRCRPGERTSPRTRASRSRAARSSTASRPTPPTRGRRTRRRAPRAATCSSRRCRTRCSRSPTRARSSRCSSSRVEPQRRLHRVDAHHPRGHQVPRRHAARRRGGEVQHRHVPVPPADGAGATRRSATSTASGQTSRSRRRAARGSPCRRTSPAASAATCSRRRGWQRCPDVPQRTEGSPVYDAALAATPADGDPAEAGRARRLHVRVVHAGQRQLVQAPCATRTTGGARTASPVRTCRTSTRSRASWPSTMTAANACAPASSTS